MLTDCEAYVYRYNAATRRKKRMDVEEYFKDIPPKGKRSMLEPYWPAIQKARAGGYTLDQIVGFLHNNSIMITRSGLFAFIKRKEAKAGTVGTISKNRNQSSQTADVAKSKTGTEEQTGNEVKTGSPTDGLNPDETSAQSLDEVLKSRGAVFDTFEQKKPSLNERFNKPKGTK